MLALGASCHHFGAAYGQNGPSVGSRGVRLATSRELTLRDRRRTLLAAGLGWTFDGYETYALDPDPGCGAACAPAGVRDPLATGKDWLRVAAVSINDDQLIR